MDKFIKFKYIQGPATVRRSSVAYTSHQNKKSFEYRRKLCKCAFIEIIFKYIACPKKVWHAEGTFFLNRMPYFLHVQNLSRDLYSEKKLAVSSISCLEVIIFFSKKFTVSVVAALKMKLRTLL